MPHEQPTGRRATAGLALGALGVVFGDIGTSPIYAFRETFQHAGLAVDQATAYGAASVVFWALIVIVSIKYLTLVMRADNHGEGGILALTALVMPDHTNHRAVLTRGKVAVVTLGVFGTALLYGDGVITPAISVLSAVEGFEIASTALTRWVIPISIAILVALFAVQHRGTAGIAKIFGPVMVLWFAVLTVLGLRQIVAHPGVLRALSPTYAIDFFTAHPGRSFVALGSIFLVVTGGEALYADMGHFGRRPIQLAWYSLVLPGLVINYFGQAALLTTDPTAIDSPFYRMAPAWGTVPLAILATCATVIASQALISGAFSLTAQAVRLDYLPRVTVRHTSADYSGQVYVPVVNWLLMVACIALVLMFRSSDRLASAYGIAVVTTMLITTLLFFRVARDRWNWPLGKALAVAAPLMVVDLAFLAANIPKIPTGGWLPLLIGILLVTVMTTWRRGRQLVAIQLNRGDVSVDDAFARATADHVARVPGTAVYLFKDAFAAPPALLSNLRHNKVLHEHTLLVAVTIDDVPRVSKLKRIDHVRVASHFHQLQLHYGFMEHPDVPAALALADIPGFEFDPAITTYFLGRESVAATKLDGMRPWREQLFVQLSRSASSAARFFSLPSGQVFEVGTPVEI